MLNFVVLPAACFVVFVVLPRLQLTSLFRESGSGRVQWFRPKRGPRPAIELASGDAVASSFSLFSIVWFLLFAGFGLCDPLERSFSDPFGWQHVHKTSNSPTTTLAALSGVGLIFTLCIAPIVTIAANYRKPRFGTLPALIPWAIVLSYTGWALLWPLFIYPDGG